MPPTFVFIRHSHRDGEGLSSHGRSSVQRTAQWLAAQRLQPDLVYTTDTPRTRETAMLAQRHVGRTLVRSLVTRGMFGSLAGLQTHTREAAARQPSGVVWFVGHHPSQVLLERLFGPELQIPDDNRCAAVAFEADGDQFRLLRYFAGVPHAPHEGGG